MAGYWEKLGKQLLFLPFRRRTPRRSAPPRALHDPAGVLVVRPDDRIGNMLLLTPLFDALKREWPRAALDVVTARSTGDLLRADPRVRRAVVFDKRRLVDGPWRLAAFVRHLRAESYDLVLDASHPQEFSLTASLIVAAARGHRKIGYAAGPAEDVLDESLAWSPDADRHQSEVFLDLLRVVVPGAASGPLTLPLSDAERSRGRAVLVEAGAESDREWVGLHPGGRGAKRWPLERFIGVARALERGAKRRVLVFQGPGETELVAAWPSDTGRIVPPLAVRDFAAALSAVRLFLAGDTGPMHLSQSVGTTTLALFLSGNHGVFGPQGPPHRVLYAPGGPSEESVRVAVEDVLAGG